MIRVFSLAVFAVFLTIALQPATAFERHNPAVFAGASTAEDQTGFTVGAGYEFRPLEQVGFGILAEFTTGVESRDLVVVLPIVSHPNRDAEGGWMLIIGPGIEKDEQNNDFLVRLGLSYGFLIEGWTLAPEFDADLVHGQWNWVYGIGLGRGF
jgi:hypothetical protein